MATPVKLKYKPEEVGKEQLAELAKAVANLADEAGKAAPANDPSVKTVAANLNKELIQLVKDAKSGYLASRISAVKRFCDTFNQTVEDYNEGVKERKDAAAAQKKPVAPPIPTNPDKVIVTGTVKGPTAWMGDYNDLLAQMKKPASYSYTGKGMGGSWEPDFRQHKCHTDSSVKGWKAYVEQPSVGAGSKWRLYFTCNDYDHDKRELTVKLIKCIEDH